jgi:hypothetical protein
VPEDWWYFPVVARLHRERTGYPTQKPEALLERIILASSNPGDIVADFFCGSGTSAVVAARLGQHFIATDASSRSIHTSRVRLVYSGIPSFSILHTHSSSLLNDNKALTDSIQVSCKGMQICLSTEQPDEIDYWEIDPDPDGETFRSAVQAVRPPRNASLPFELTLPPITSTHPAAIRVVDIHGRTCCLQV